MAGLLRLSYSNPEFRLGETGGAWRLTKQGNVGASGPLALQHSTDDFATIATTILTVNPNTGLLAILSGIALNSPVSASGSTGGSDRILSGGGSPAWRSVADLMPSLFYANRAAAGASSITPYTVGVWNDVALNTVVHNNIPGAAPSAGRVSLPVGTYRARFQSAIAAGLWADLQLLNATDSVLLGIATGNPPRADGWAEFTLAGPKSIALQIRPNGVQAQFDAYNSGNPDEHAGLWFEKIA
jgi:hypothetical protein